MPVLCDFITIQFDEKDPEKLRVASFIHTSLARKVRKIPYASNSIQEDSTKLRRCQDTRRSTSWNHDCLAPI